jgi:hypothetical protein
VSLMMINMMMIIRKMNLIIITVRKILKRNKVSRIKQFKK